MEQTSTNNLITPEEAGTLFGLFYERVQRTPENLAYRFFDDMSKTWKDLTLMPFQSIESSQA